MAEAQQQPKLIIPPLPEAVRGYGIHIDISKKDERLMYCNGNHVFIRSLDDPTKVDVFSEHKTHVLVAKFSPNGEWVASGDDRGRVIVWGTKNKNIKNTVQVNQKVLDIGWSDDGQRIVAVGSGADSAARVFSWDTGNALGEIAGHTKAILSVSFKPNRPYRIVTASEDKLSNFYEGPPFKFKHSMNEHEAFVNCVRHSFDGSRFFTVGADSKIIVFDGSDGHKLISCDSKDAHQGSIFAATWSPDGKQIMTVSGDKTAKVWNAENGALVKTYHFGNNIEDMQVGAAWSAHFMVTVSLSGAINILDPDSDKPKSVILGHQGIIRAVVYDPKHNTLISSDQNGFLCHWDLSTHLAQWEEGKGHGGKGIVALATNSTGDMLITAGADDKLHFNETKSHVFSADAVPATGMPTGIATAHKDADLAFVTVAQGHVVVLRKGHVISKVDVKYRPNCVAVAPDDTEIAVGGDDKKLHLFSVEHDTLKEVAALPGEITGAVNAVSYSPDGVYIATSDQQRSTLIWDRATKTVKNPTGWQTHTSKVYANGWAPSSQKLATGGQDQHIIVWEVSNTNWNGDRYRMIELGHAEGAIQVGFINENLLFSAGNDRTIKFWDA